MAVPSRRHSTGQRGRAECESPCVVPRQRPLVARGAYAEILHRSVLDAGIRDLARQALEAAVPIDLIDSEEGRPRGLKADDNSLE
jgi:hypothetical protein